MLNFRIYGVYELKYSKYEFPEKKHHYWPVGYFYCCNLFLISKTKSYQTHGATQSNKSKNCARISYIWFKTISKGEWLVKF